MKYGVPQGSTLGPLLFILYVNDLLSSLVVEEKSGVLMYADDTVLYAIDANPKHSIIKCQSLLDKLENWCKLNKLTINISKTKHMFIPRNDAHRDLIQDINVNIASETLYNVTSYKYLGIDLDQTLSFDNMVESKIVFS